MIFKERSSNVQVGIPSADMSSVIQMYGLSGRPVCLHVSMRSFGGLIEGPRAMVESFLRNGCTVITPTFTWEHMVCPGDETNLARNAGSASGYPRTAPPYSVDSVEVAAEMGATAAAVAGWPNRARGVHPVCSFSAVGPLAYQLVEKQSYENPFAPLRELADRGGAVVLAGVGLDCLTMLHLAEVDAGREPFRRWAVVSHGAVVRVAVGGCSRGFPQLSSLLSPFITHTSVASSRWMILPAADIVKVAAAHICEHPEVTRCTIENCLACRDGIEGGPVIHDGS